MLRLVREGFGEDRVGPGWIGGETTSRERFRLGEPTGHLGGFKEHIQSFIAGTSSKRPAHDRCFEEAEAEHSPAAGPTIPGSQ